MKEIPVLFNGAMVRAIQDDRKTQTRRPLKPHLQQVEAWRTDGHGRFYGVSRLATTGGLGVPETDFIESPLGKPGDRLWVRETFAECGGQVVYRADNPDGYPGANFQPWRSPLAMPRHLSRLTLEVESVREEDARAEGVTPFPCDPDGDCWTDGTHRTAFNYAWNEKHGWWPNAWDRNDWVFALTFKRAEGCR